MMQRGGQAPSSFKLPVNNNFSVETGLIIPILSYGVGLFASSAGGECHQGE